jgi:antigen flippase
VIKMAGWLFGYVLVARIPPLQIGLFELAKGGAWIVFAHWFVPTGGAIGAVQSYVATYAVYLLATAGYVWLLTRRANDKATP